jgi:LacI family transcriptional regulator
MNIHEVARRAKVSIASVSRVMNNLPGVSPAVAARISRVAEELGYYPDTQARALASGRSRIVGLVVSDVTNPFFPELLQVFQDMAADDGYEVLLHSTNYNPGRMTRAVRQMLERKVEGIAVMTSEFDEELLQGLTDRRVPLVFVDMGPRAPHVSNIVVKYRPGMEQAVRHLIRLGHRRIAFVSGPLSLESARFRQSIFLECMAEHGLDVPPHLLIEGDHHPEGGLRCVAQLLGSKEAPTAVMTANDSMAIGLLLGLDREGMRAPDDLSVVGFDDIHLSQFTVPPLTTVQLSRKELGSVAYSALLADIRREVDAERGVEYSVETRLIVRSSTGAAAAPREALAPGFRQVGRGRRGLAKTK